jgi:hypothetical protein
VRGVHGTIRLDTGRRRSGEGVEGALVLAPWEGVVVLPA